MAVIKDYGQRDVSTAALKAGCQSVPSSESAAGANGGGGGMSGGGKPGNGRYCTGAAPNGSGGR